MKKLLLKLICFSLLLFFFMSPLVSFAAQFNLEAYNIEVQPGGTVEVRITLNADKQEVNAVSGKLFFDKEQLVLSEIKDGQSIVNLWVEKPRENQDGVVFSGIIPGGYSQDGGLIFSAIFRVKNIQVGSVGSITIAQPQVLLNDGAGTAAKVSISNYFYQAGNPDQSIPLNGAEPDTRPPEQFTPIIDRNENIFDNQWFLSFLTQDKESGVDYYEVKEGVFGRYQKADSPYLLKDQNLSSRISIRAFDKAGNFRLIEVEARNENVAHTSILYGIITLLLVLIVWYFRNKNHNKSFKI